MLTKNLELSALNSVKMSDDSTMSKGMNHSTSELRLIEIEARLKKQEKFSITVENLSKELNEMKTQLVKIFYVS